MAPNISPKHFQTYTQDTVRLDENRKKKPCLFKFAIGYSRYLTYEAANIITFKQNFRKSSIEVALGTINELSEPLFLSSYQRNFCSFRNFCPYTGLGISSRLNRGSINPFLLAGGDYKPFKIPLVLTANLRLTPIRKEHILTLSGDLGVRVLIKK